MRRFIIFLAIAALAVLGYFYLYGGHRNIESENAQYALTAKQIHSEFNSNTEVSQNKYLNETIEISGLVSEFSKTEITLDGKVFCQFSDKISQPGIQLNSKIKIKGRFIGYDDLLEQIKLDQCTIINVN